MYCVELGGMIVLNRVEAATSYSPIESPCCCFDYARCPTRSGFWKAAWQTWKSVKTD